MLLNSKAKLELDINNGVLKYGTTTIRFDAANRIVYCSNQNMLEVLEQERVLFKDPYSGKTLYLNTKYFDNPETLI
jgi:hypothetical protein